VKTLIIAEAGVNHNGDLRLARRMIVAAAQAGADLVKFQTFSADRLVTPGAKKAAYQAERTSANETQHAMLRRLELSEPMHRELLAECATCGVGFLSTGFDEKSVDLLASLGQTRFKIPSGEITNLPYLRHVGAYGREILLSTGMATLAEVESALEALIRAGTPRDHITVLQCNTAYPTPPGDANLRAMLTLRDVLGVAVGYSDHTAGIEIALAAVALGASVIEKHFTIDRDLPGPDQAASLEPEELKSMVVAIRNVELALGDGIKRVTPSEAGNMASARKSLVAAKAIRAGERFDRANLAVKRPGTGISPMRWDDVLGRPAPRDYEPDELIEL
jgi:N,N'-diacetyllegionaminate synthase